MSLLKIALLSLALTACITDESAPEESEAEELLGSDLLDQCETLGQIVIEAGTTNAAVCGPDDV